MARPYHKRWHGNALGGMRGLTLEERGAYNTLLDMMYDRGGPLADDERRICGELDCDIRVWRRVRENLVKKQKIAVHGGLIYARRVDQELGTSAELPAEVREKFAIATQQLSPKLDEKPKENKPTPAQKITESEALFQSPESRTPKAPKGASVRQDDVDAIWAMAPKVSRTRSGKIQLKDAMAAVAKAGHDPGRVRLGLQRYFASEEATRDDGRFVAGVHRLVKGGRWEAFVTEGETASEAELPLLAAVAGGAQELAGNPWFRRVREYAKNRYWNRLEWGNPPGAAGCAADDEVLVHFGFTGDLVQFPNRAAG
jgi:uncharacterized protein YdaU (DUF1376 family)